MAVDSRKMKEESSETGMIRSSIAMPQDMYDALDRVARRRRSGRSTVIREACARLLETEDAASREPSEVGAR